MMEVIALAGVVLSQASKLKENETVGKAVEGVIKWIGSALGKPSAREKLQQIEANQQVEDNVNSIKANLEFVLEDNQALQSQLAAKLEELQNLMQKEGIPMPSKTNTMNITGNENIGFQDINAQGNINITR
ncbi:MAG: hypothetical protein EA393_14590 [Bacteroidetes bacterium]|nr:MAG: hypothetical protein EA393_14590 [Bacteroidota bacterium]